MVQILDSMGENSEVARTRAEILRGYMAHSDVPFV